jgi:hypothetical protein
MSPNNPTVATRLALIEQAQQATNAKLDELLALVKATNGRVAKVEAQELICQAKGMPGLPERVSQLEDARKRLEGGLGLVRWVIGGNLLTLLTLVALVVSLVRRGWSP